MLRQHPPKKKITRTVGQRAEAYLIYVHSSERSGPDWPRLAQTLGCPVTGTTGTPAKTRRDLTAPLQNTGEKSPIRSAPVQNIRHLQKPHVSPIKKFQGWNCHAGSPWPGPWASARIVVSRQGSKVIWLNVIRLKLKSYQLGLHRKASKGLL